MTDRIDVRPERAAPRFGDVVENDYASPDNPTRRGYFVREFKRTGKLNPGLTWEVTDGDGKFWELQPRVIGERLTVTPSATALSALEKERDALKALVGRMVEGLGGQPCFGCGERLGEPSEGCITCRRARSLLSEAKGRG